MLIDIDNQHSWNNECLAHPINKISHFQRKLVCENYFGKNQNCSKHLLFIIKWGDSKQTAITGMAESQSFDGGCESLLTKTFFFH